MKYFAVLFLFVLISIPVIAQSSDSTSTTAKDTLTKDILSGKPMLLGEVNREAFADTSFSWWFESVHDMYEPDSTLIPQIAEALKGAKIKIVMGTWCSDSRREVPRFFKILDEVNYPSDSVQIFTVDRGLHGFKGDVKPLDIEKVPEFIFYRDGKELGRIVESPKETLEKDMLKILKG